MRIEPTDALVVVDIQNDFCEGGALAVDGGEDIVPIVNRLIPRFAHRVFTRDWHPVNHCSFSGEPRYVDKSWPVHCVQNTYGAEFHPGLEIPDDAIIGNKAVHADKEVYSIFEESTLAGDLRQRGVKRLFVCGIATDYCVRATTSDALKEGFEVVVILDTCRAVDPEGTGARAIEEMEAAGARLCMSGEIE